MKPTISVIVPVLNRERLILRCLDSILHQTVKPYEIIVVDNGSEDNTYQLVENWMGSNRDCEINLKLIRQPIKGACVARQKGLENAEGDFVSFFDSDDVMLPDLIERVTETLSLNPESDIVCWPCRIILLDGSIRIPPFLPHNPIEGHLIHTLLRPQGYIVRKDFIERSAGWSKSIKVWNDFELGLRLILKNPACRPINKVLAEIYSQEESITGKDFSSKEGDWEKTIEEMEKVNSNSNHPEKAKIAKILNYRKAILAAHYYREGNKNGASKLMEDTLANKTLYQKLVLTFSYHYTRLGMRGAWRIVRFAY